MNTKKYKKGEIIFSENSQSDEMYVIKNGSVEIFKTLNGEKILLTILKTGSFFGEMSFLLNGLRSASVKALEDSEIVLIDKNLFLEKIQKEPKFAMNVIKVLVKRLKEAHNIISEIEGAKKSLEIMYGINVHNIES